MKPTVLLITTEQFDVPLSQMSDKRIRGMSRMADHYVVGYSSNRSWRAFEHCAHFYLVPYLPVHFLRQALFLTVVFLMVIYLHLRKGVNVAICLSPLEGFAMVIAARCLRLWRRKVSTVVSVHGDWREASFLLGRLPSLFRPIAYRIGRFALRHCDLVRTISQFTLRDAECLTSKPCVVFPGFTDIDLFLEPVQKDEEIESPSKTILYVGVLTALKGVTNLIDAVACLKDSRYDVQLVVVGEGEDRELLQNLANERRLSDSVEFLGHVDQPTVKWYMNHCDIFVLPSLTEGFGRVIIEAMACARPVVASRVGGIPELVSDQSTGLLVEAGSVQDLVQKLMYLLHHDELRTRMGVQGRTIVRANYSNEAYFKNYQKLLEVALNVTGPAPHQEQVEKSVL